ncbi:hypothetical protein K3W82_14775, partial [Listeria monocytogenes]|nr:hypothetical protein [Listeria monocytogenes]
MEPVESDLTGVKHSHESDGSKMTDPAGAPREAIVRMYAAREDIFPREIEGRYATLRWACVWLTQILFYGLPWLNMNGRQAV